MPRGIPSKTPNRQHRVIGGDRTIDDPRYKMFHNAKHRAKKKGIPFTITMDDIVIPPLCPLLEIELIPSSDRYSHNTPSLDRIDSDPAIGYTPDNIQVISRRANWLKADATVEELELICFGLVCPATT